ncbi:MAG: malto-oligosyltrehalose trehalohydrolase [Dehalococcoidia bacterium]|nr:malto-oligosyltrehalose trehalohydrolase [Dehalococcoidia bacterium]
MSGEPPWQGTLGASPGPDGTPFRVWADRAGLVELAIEGREPVPMTREGEYWTASVGGELAGARYRYRVDGQAFPDPCSRRQPEGVHGPSEVVDPRAFAWSDSGWRPPAIEELVIYEAHIGTLTPEGTFAAAAGQFARLRELGVTAIEVMPIGAFPGRRNWGYDGVAIYAPAEPYGGPEGFRRFVDAAHGAGLAVILDVVYNHLGPDGNYTGAYSKQYLTGRHHTPWGDALNFDDDGAAQVRAFFRENLLHWLHEYHVDGFRLDATHAIVDDSSRHFLADLAEAVHAHPRDGHVPWLIAESNENEVRYLRPLSGGGFGFDGVWADDFHHAVRTMVTRGREGYLGSYAGSAGELARTIEQGFLFEGQEDPFSGEPRGTQAREQPWRQFVYCIQNHDQVGNQALGLRLHHLAGVPEVLAATALLLLLPQTPMLFQGQEFLASTPFLFFTDHNAELGQLVTEGRRKEFEGFSAFQDPAMRERIPDPQAEATFAASVLRLEEASRGIGALAHEYHRDLLTLRREDPVLRAARSGRPALRMWTSGKAVVVEVSAGGGRRWIAVNLGDRDECVAVEGLTALNGVLISSDSVRYGGFGAEPRLRGGLLEVPGRTGSLIH